MGRKENLIVGGLVILLGLAALGVLITRQKPLEQTDEGPPVTGKIFFTSGYDDNWDIYVMNADGSNVTQLTHGGSNGGGSWSPDGKKIVFETNRDGSYQIYVMNADGSNQRRLTYNSFQNFGPRWSPP